MILIFFCSHLYYAKTVKVQEIFLSGDITNPNNEISGMDWYRDYLYLIPENLNNFIYVIPKFDIDNYILSKKLYWIIQIGSLEHIVRHIPNDFDDNLDVIHMVYFNNYIFVK